MIFRHINTHAIRHVYQHFCSSTQSHRMSFEPTKIIPTSRERERVRARFSLPFARNVRCIPYICTCTARACCHPSLMHLAQLQYVLKFRFAYVNGVFAINRPPQNILSLSLFLPPGKLKNNYTSILCINNGTSVVIVIHLLFI